MYKLNLKNTESLVQTVVTEIYFINTFLTKIVIFDSYYFLNGLRGFHLSGDEYSSH